MPELEITGPEAEEVATELGALLAGALGRDIVPELEAALDEPTQQAATEIGTASGNEPGEREGAASC